MSKDVETPAPRAQHPATDSARRAQGRWLPQGRRGPMVWIIAVMTFLTLLSGASGLALAHALVQMRGDLAGGYTVQLPEANPQRRQAQVARVAERLRRDDAVRSVAVVPERELLRQLEPWIGKDAQAQDVPVPALIDIALAPGESETVVARVERAVRAVAPNARIDAHQLYLAPVEQLMRTLMWLAAGLVGMMILVTGGIVTLAARGAHEAHRTTIDVMHLLGATDLQIARLFQRRIALDALFGGLVGTAGAALLIWLVAGNIAELDSGLGAAAAFPWRLALLLLAIPLMSVLVAATTARVTVKRALERSL